MKIKRIKLVLFIIVILITAFFWGGNKEVIPLSQEQMNNDLVASKDVTNIDDDTHKDITKIETDKLGNVDSKNKEELLETELKLEEKQSAEIYNPLNEIKDKNEITEKEKDKSVDEIAKEQKDEKEKIIAEDNRNKDKKDKYLTDPVPEGKPKPVEWQDLTISKDKELTATLSVTCKSILNNMDMFNMDKVEVLPEDGVIYKTQIVTFFEGESVFDVLLREMINNSIHMEFEMTPIYNSNYIEGINNLYEFDCGELSGWMYKVNDWFPNYGCSRYLLSDGDVIEWIYTCDLGRDIGGESAIKGGE